MNLQEEFECYSSIDCIEKTLREIEGLMATDLSIAVRTVSTGIDALKKLTDLAAKAQNIELHEGILELREKILEIKESLLKAKEENFGLQKENKFLKEKVLELSSGTQEKLVLKSGLYYAENDDVPFCVGCHDNRQVKIHLSNMTSSLRRLGYKYECPVCKFKYGAE